MDGPYRLTTCTSRSVGSKELQRKNRIKGHWYYYYSKGELELRYWDGRKLRCEHARDMGRCKKCRGGGICEHNRVKSTCAKCKGGGICEHNIRRSRCNKCGGGGICEHSKQKDKCKDCGGAGICEHNRLKHQCNICSPNSRHFCERCHFISGRYRLIPKKNKKVKMCVDCFYHTYPDEIKPRSKYKRKQHYIHEKLKETYGEDFFKYDKRVECGCSRKIPDWFRDCFHFVLNIECDEDQHKINETSCENKRLMELFLDCANRPFVCLRFNPDKYTNNKGEKVEGCFSFDTKNTLIINQQEFERRWNILKERIDHFLEHGPDKEVELEKLFYDGFD